MRSYLPAALLLFLINVLQAQTEQAPPADSLHKQARMAELLRPSASVDSAEYATRIGRDQMMLSNYRYAGNFFSIAPAGYLHDPGLHGMPAELSVYGAGYDGVTYMYDGQLINGRTANAFDLLSVSAETIDTIEIIPSTRGFLYSAENNQSAVSIRTIQKYNHGKSGYPYTRIKYYQAPNQEAMIDGTFAAFLSSKAYLNLNFSNNSNNSYYISYIGSDYTDLSSLSHWKANARLSYILSGRSTLNASYRYINSDTKINGGVSADSLKSLYGSGWESRMYDRSFTPLKYRDRYQKFTRQDLSLQLISKPAKGYRLEVSARYNYDLTEFKQNQNLNILINPNAYVINGNNNIKTFSAETRHIVSLAWANAEVLAGYEYNKLASTAALSGYSASSFYSSAKLSFGGIVSNLIPSVYAKMLRRSSSLYNGAGADITYNFNTGIQLFAGASFFKKPYSPSAVVITEAVGNALDYIYQSGYKHPGDKTGVTSVEAGIKYYSPQLTAQLSVYRRNYTDKIFAGYITTDNIREKLFYFLHDENLTGAALGLKSEIGHMLIEASASLYNSAEGAGSHLPSYNMQGGIYYKDILFSGNLHMKTGIAFQAGKEDDSFNYNFEWQVAAVPFIIGTDNRAVKKPMLSKTFLQVDYLFFGQIQKSATIYFAFENMLNAKYYLTPYYPMRARGIRFGFSWEFLN